MAASAGYVTDPYILLFTVPCSLAELIIISYWLYRKYDKGIWLLSSISFLLCLFKIFSQLVLNNIFNRFFWDTLLYFGAGIYLLYKSKPLNMMETGLLLFVPCMLLFFPMLQMGIDYGTYPLLIIPVVAWALLYGYYRIQRRFRIIYLCGTLIIISTLSFFIYPNFWSYSAGTLYTHTNVADQRRFLNITSSAGDTSTLSAHKGIVVIDTWYTHCSACFKGFPSLEKLAGRYRSDTEVSIAALNLPMPGEPADAAFDPVRQYHFLQFRSVTLLDHNQWKIRAYPTLLIFDRHGCLRYQGELNIDRHILINNAITIIEGLKREQ